MLTELSIDQSQHLIDLGVDPKLASKCQWVEKLGYSMRGITRMPISKPIFDLSDVIGILPNSYFNEEYHNTMNLCIEHLNNKWFVNYRYYAGGEIVAQDVEKEAPELIDALYQLLCWWLTREPKTEEK